jgi:hypothetical protein
LSGERSNFLGISTLLRRKVDRYRQPPIFTV